MKKVISAVIKQSDRFSEVIEPLVLIEKIDEQGNTIYIPEKEACTTRLDCDDDFSGKVQSELFFELNGVLVIQVAGTKNAKEYIRLINLKTQYLVDIPNMKDGFCDREKTGDIDYIKSHDSTVIYAPKLLDEVIYYPGLYNKETLDNRLEHFPLFLQDMDPYFEYYVFVTNQEGEIQAHFNFADKSWTYWEVQDNKSINIENISRTELSNAKCFVDRKNYIFYSLDGKKLTE